MYTAVKFSCGLARRRPVIVQQFLSTVKTLTIVNKSTEKARPHCFFLPQYQLIKKKGFLVRAEKGIAWHIEVSSVVWTFYIITQIIPAFCLVLAYVY